LTTGFLCNTWSPLLRDVRTKKKCPHAISIHLVVKKKISTLHKQFFNDSSPTDCISFPIDSTLLGEVFVCPQVAKEYAPLHPYVETSLYIIHGILHLLGYDDTEKKRRDAMMREQRRLLALSSKNGCILISS
jgi:probable rRNA maturation factor